MILDYYFRKPVLIDYLVGLLSSLVLFILYKKNRFVLPKTEDSYSLTSDLTNITLTMAGFILTILTVLITFKDNSISKNSAESHDETKSIFAQFFSTGYYSETIKHLKNCIQSIILVAAIGFFMKLLCPFEFRKFFFFYNVLGLIITILTVWRCLLILTKVLNLQNEK